MPSPSSFHDLRLLCRKKETDELFDEKKMKCGKNSIIIVITIETFIQFSVIIISFNLILILSLVFHAESLWISREHVEGSRDDGCRLNLTQIIMHFAFLIKPSSLRSYVSGDLLFVFYA